MKNCIYKHKNYPELEFASEEELLQFLSNDRVQETIPVPILNNLQFVSYNADNLFSKAVRNNETKDYELKEKSYNSVTGKVIPLFQTRPYTITDTPGERLIKNLWKDEDPLALKIVEHLSITPINAETAKSLEDNRYTVGMAKGTIFHKIIHLHFSNDSNAQMELQQLYDDHKILPSEFEWLDAKTVENIIKKTGTDYFEKSPLDRIHTEKTFVSNLLGWAGTADLLIDHGDDIYSIFDLKTGKAFNRIFENSFLKYGNTSTSNIFDNPRNRAKLQVMLYAFILKVENPNVRFRNLELLHVKNRWNIDEHDAMRHVDVPAFLEIIKGTLKNEHPLVYKKLKDLEHFNAIFTPSSYTTITKNEFEDTHPNADSAMMLKLYIQELQSLIMYDRDIVNNILKSDEDSLIRYKKIEELTSKILKLRKDSELDYKSWDTDMGWMDRWLGSASASTNPYVKIYYRMMTENKQKARDEYQFWREKFDGLINKLMVEKNLKPLTTLIGGVNRTELFRFAYKNEGAGDDIRRRLVHNEDPEYKLLSNTEQSFIDFVNNSVGQFFVDELSTFIDPLTQTKKALANQIITYKKVRGKDIGITNLDLYNKAFDKATSGKRPNPFKYYKGFLPKYLPQMEDISRKHGGYFTKEMLNFIKNRYTTNYFEAVYDGWYNTEEAIPMKYLGGGSIDSNENYTLNLELSIDSFVKQHYYKQHLDSTYTFGQAIKLYLIAQQNKGQGVTYDKLIEWFDDSLNLHILGRKQKEWKVGTRAFGVITENNYTQFNFAKFLRSLKNFFSGPTMWLKPLTGLPNFVFASLVNLKEAIKNSAGLGGPNSNFGIGDLAYGFKEAIAMQVNSASNLALRKNKAYLLMEKYGYLPDSYDWFTAPNQLLTAKNKMFTTKTMMLFHSLPEEVIATAVFIAQLRSMKYTVNGVTKTMWDGYGEPQRRVLSDGTEYYDIEWTGDVRGKRNISNVADSPLYEDIKGLTIEEMNAIKFLYEKMHGGYRADERIAAEYYVGGELIFQLKKYMPSILKNIWASRGVRDTQGTFKTEIDANGIEVLKWTPEVIEGRYRILFGMLFNMLSSKKSKDGDKGNKILSALGIQFDSAYKWSDLSDAQKADMRDFLLTGAMWGLLLIGYFNLWDRDDEDTFKKIYGRVANDFAGNVSPLEIVKNVTGMIQPVSARKSYKLLESSTELFYSALTYELGDDEALTRQGNLRGWNEFQRNIHFLSSYHDLIRGIKESDVLSEYYK